MALVCMLGLTACLSFGGNAIPATDAFKIMDSCDLLPQLRAVTFVTHASEGLDMRAQAMQSFGVAVGIDMQKLGLKLPWPASGSSRKQQWLMRCRQFSAAFYDRSQGWSHLEKWPQ